VEIMAAEHMAIETIGMIIFLNFVKYSPHEKYFKCSLYCTLIYESYAVKFNNLIISGYRESRIQVLKQCMQFVLILLPYVV
jgi:hypothetical protein